MHSCLIEVRVERDGKRLGLAEIWHDGGRRLRAGDIVVVERYDEPRLVVVGGKLGRKSKFTDVRDDRRGYGWMFKEGDRLTVIEILPELFR